MKRKTKFSLVLLLFCSSLLLAQNTCGVFQVEIGTEVAFQIVEASHEMNVSTTTGKFEGCSNGASIVSNGTTIIVEVTNFTTDELKFKTKNLTPEIIGTCLSDFDPQIYYNYLIAAYLFLSTDFDIVEIVSSGVVSPVYFETFEVPLFVDPKPQTWIDFAGMETFVESMVLSIFGSWDTCNVDAIYSDVSNKMTLSLLFDASAVLDPTTEFSLDSTTSFSYNMTTGVLIEAETHYTIFGLYQSAPIIANSDYKIEQTDVPINSFNFLEFLGENKWYFIGGSGGVILIITTIVVVSLVRKRNRTTKKSTKSKSSKEKSSKKKKGKK
ncbi:MAG: hypothetical protein FK733_01105 [Asgard group archaeon]|nr:hypothetical protein [Asgard group archaeon]